ncbi:N-acetylmuramoyl-L-alanine amidase family protein [Bacillus sp. BGMRC 2118]|nr:N-acetylmuramoyl-L-alanine amidase family protein [Bacillus sp. BGMRC 2118]
MKKWVIASSLSTLLLTPTVSFAQSNATAPETETSAPVIAPEIVEETVESPEVPVTEETPPATEETEGTETAPATEEGTEIAPATEEEQEEEQVTEETTTETPVVEEPAVEAPVVEESTTTAPIEQNTEIILNGWVTDEYGDTYYYIDGEAQTGWLELDGKKYYLYEWSGILAKGWTDIYTQATDSYDWYYLNPTDGAVQKGWVKTEHYYSDEEYPQEGWFYFNQDGTMHTGWLQSGKKWYYLTSDEYYYAGLLLENTVEYIDGSYYYFDKDGYMFTGGWYYDGYDWLYAKANGKLQTGWLAQGKNWYYFYEDYPYMVTGPTEINGTTYFFNTNGTMKTNGWASITHDYGDGEVYTTYFYVNANGTLYKGWLKQGTTWYYLHPEYGFMATGSEKVGGTLYFFDKSGALSNKKGWVSDEYKNWFYLLGNGVAKTGWLSSGGQWYYLDKDWGYMYESSFMTENNKLYYFNKSGVMVKNKWIQDEYNGTWSYFTASGAAVKNDWLKVGGAWYYFDNQAEMVTGYYTIGFQVHYFNENGVWIESRDVSSL